MLRVYKNMRIRHIKLERSKDPLKTFVGGLLIGTIIGILTLYI